MPYIDVKTFFENVTQIPEIAYKRDLNLYFDTGIESRFSNLDTRNLDKLSLYI